MGTGTVYSTHGMNDDGTLKRDSIIFMLIYSIQVPYRDSTLSAYMGTGKVSDPHLDPDPHGSAIIGVAGSGSGSVYKLQIRIRIQEGKKMTHKNREKSRIFMFLSTECSLLRAEGFSCNLGVLYGGLGTSKLQYLMKKIEIKFPAIN
jgi:hypothetical protein